MLIGNTKCHLQWFRYPESESDWVPEKNISAGDLVQNFWENLGVPRESIRGKPIECSAEFIGKLLDIYKSY
jgi:hypothetical protein